MASCFPAARPTMFAVLLIAALLATLALAGVRELLHGNRLAGAVQDFSVFAGLARGRALAERRTLEIRFALASGESELRFRKQDGTYEILDGPRRLDERLLLSRAEDPKDFLVVMFHPDGSLTLTPDAASLSFDLDPAAHHDLALRDRDGPRAAYLDFVGPTARLRASFQK